MEKSTISLDKIAQKQGSWEEGQTKLNIIYKHDFVQKDMLNSKQMRKDKERQNFFDFLISNCVKHM